MSAPAADERLFCKRSLVVTWLTALPVAALLLLGCAQAPAARRAETDLRPGEPGPKADPRWMAALREPGERKVYRGAELETIGMPCGGIAAGQLYVRGDGTLGQWWIANNCQFTGYGANCYRTYRPPSPIDQGFTLRIDGGGKTVERPLSRDGFDAISFVGEYPIAEIRYRTKDKAALPVQADLAVFSPFIPLNARDSALPATVMQFTLKSTAHRPVTAHLVGRLGNLVCHDLAGTAGLMGRNRPVKRGDLSAVVMDVVKVTPKQPAEAPRVTVFEDFEKGSYEGWTISGNCFGSAPVTGTLPNQQVVRGWHGKGLVNTYLGRDGPKGTAVSRPFTITEPYITFLVGGGNHVGATCMNLVVGGKVVRTVTGRNDEKLVPHAWDVRDLKGKEAHLQIVDKHSGAWGHINIDYIRFTNVPPTSYTGPLDEHPAYGTMVLAALDAGAAVGTVADASGTVSTDAEVTYPVGTTRSGAVSASLSLEPGQTRTVTFLVTWYFPNRDGTGRAYANWFASALGVAEYVAASIGRLRAETYLFRDTYFDTTLPYWFAARLTMPVSTLATETCQWWKSGRFYAWEGVCCCAGTCTHVWNYEHACARLFPELARSTRLMQDLAPDAGFDDKTGLVGFRSNRAYAADGQCGTVLKIYREHLMSADNGFLDKAWPGAKKAIEFSVGHDRNEDGLIEDSQHNTFDINFVGPNTFVGSLYLGALRAAEEMARLKGEGDLADRYHAIFEKGRDATMKRLFNGEYFTQIIPEGASDRHQYGRGCLADQVFGQGWAHQVGLGYIYPPEAVRSALRSVFTYAWTADTGPYNQRYKPSRWFARAGEGGLFICTWPRGGRPAEPVRYRNEVWTGIEYQVAGHMLWEGMVDEALAIVRAVHERYDGTKHNPWNEVECGDHYARAMASWGCLIGVEGYVYDGPAGVIGFAPRMTPEDFKAFFTAAEGWGSLVQKRSGRTQTNRIEVAYGTLRARTLLLEVDRNVTSARATVTAAGRNVAAHVKQDGTRVTLTLARPVEVRRGETIDVTLRG